MRSEEHNGGVLPKKVRSMISLQKLWRLGAAVVLVLTALTACGSGDSAAEPDQPVVHIHDREHDSVPEFIVEPLPVVCVHQSGLAQQFI